MKKQESMAEEGYGWFATDSMEMVDAAEVMTKFLTVQHRSALKLTKLTLEYCKIENITQDKIFAIFQDAINLTSKNLKPPIG